jgi:signal transduction histidine kinase
VVGSGIGLTLSKMLVETMEGSIAIDSAVGDGTTVTVELRSAHAL